MTWLAEFVATETTRTHEIRDLGASDDLVKGRLALLRSLQEAMDDAGQALVTLETAAKRTGLQAESIRHFLKRHPEFYRERAGTSGRIRIRESDLAKLPKARAPRNMLALGGTVRNTAVPDLSALMASRNPRPPSTAWDEKSALRTSQRRIRRATPTTG